MSPKGSHSVRINETRLPLINEGEECSSWHAGSPSSGRHFFTCRVCKRWTFIFYVFLFLDRDLTTSCCQHTSSLSMSSFGISPRGSCFEAARGAAHLAREGGSKIDRPVIAICYTPHDCRADDSSLMVLSKLIFTGLPVSATPKGNLHSHHTIKIN